MIFDSTVVTNFAI